MLKRIARRIMLPGPPEPDQEHPSPPSPVRWGDLRRLEPKSRTFGMDRGLPICRHYIHAFLRRHADDVRGSVLEFGDDTYTRRFGDDRVTRSDVLHATADNPKATIVADLTAAREIRSDTFDCIICTQTLQFIFDVRAAASTLYRILQPGGVLLATLSGISPISRYDMDRWGEYWRFTTASASRLFEEHWPESGLTVRAHGNVVAATAYLQGLATEELDPRELTTDDPDYQIQITVRAVKPERISP